MDDGTTYYVEEVKDREKRLLAKTMYKNEGRFNAKNALKGHVQNGSPQFTKIIPNPNLKVNQNINQNLNQTAKGRITFSNVGNKLSALIQLFKGTYP
jgi:hypothetical protein